VESQHRAPVLKPTLASPFKQSVLLGLCCAGCIWIPFALSLHLFEDLLWVCLPELWQTTNSVLICCLPP